ncbi:MAG: AAA family ATPase [Firmicutes bacterium]|nr:AAA family ATPase [Bacillota bacterium]
MTALRQRPPATVVSVPRLEYLRVRNYRALRDVEFKNLAPLTVLLGPNGSGKSTVFDVFAFLSECFTVGLRRAWDKRNRFRELRTRGSDGDIVIEIKYREKPGDPLITYHLAIGEEATGPVVTEEWLQWRRRPNGRPFRFLNFQRGTGEVISGDNPDEFDDRIPETLESPEILAVNTLGQLARHPRVSALRRFITSWYLSYLSADSARSVPEAGPQERLSQTGDNLPNVIQYLRERHPSRFQEIVSALAERVPRLEKVDAELLADGRLLLEIKDAPFERPILAKFASDGTLKMLSYLIILYDPTPPPLIGIEESENHIHPRLLPGLAEECRSAAARSQLMITSHSPYLVDGLRPEELWVLWRDRNGYTQARRADEMKGVREFLAQGAKLGQLWMEGFFEVGDPLAATGAPIPVDESRPAVTEGSDAH